MRRPPHHPLRHGPAALACLGLALAGISVAGPSVATETGLSCAIEGQASPGGMIRLEAVLDSGAAGFVGRYRLSIRTVGHGGQSTSLQSGHVRLHPGERKGLGIVAIGAGAMHVEALLTVRSADGRECTARY